MSLIGCVNPSRWDVQIHLASGAFRMRHLERKAGQEWDDELVSGHGAYWELMVGTCLV